MKLAVIGDPVAHSRSPRLHRAFLRRGRHRRQLRCDSGPASGSAVRASAASGRGIYRLQRDVSAQRRSAAYRAARSPARRARAGAVNTILFGSEILGTNTDGIGARSAIERLLDEPVALKRIGVFGYGATARAILAELHDNDAYAFVWGRDRASVADVCERFEAEPWPGESPPEIAISTLPPEAELPPEIVHDLRVADS